MRYSIKKQIGGIILGMGIAALSQACGEERPNLTSSWVSDSSTDTTVHREWQYKLHQDLEGLRLASLYSHELGVFELELIQGELALIRDPNRCRLDAFGDRFACTKMAVFRTKVGLRLQDEREGKYLFQLTGVEGYFFVVDHSYQTPSYRLKILRGDREFVEALIPVQRIKQIPSYSDR